MSATSEPPYLYLTTIGRMTGNPHEIEIWFVEHAGNFYLTSGGKDRSDWVQNLIANPSITLRVGRRDAPLIDGGARVLESNAEPELIATVRALMNRKYNWSDSFIVELKPA